MKYFYTNQTVPFFLVICFFFLVTGSTIFSFSTAGVAVSLLPGSAAAIQASGSIATFQVNGTLVNNMEEPVAGHLVNLYDENSELIASDRSDSLGLFVLSYETEPVSTDPVDDPGSGQRDAAQTPSGFKLGSSYPNPFNPRTRVPFQVPVNTAAHIAVYNILGQQVMQTRAELGPGTCEIEVNLGGQLSQGHYLLRVQGQGYSLTQSMTFVSAGISSGTAGITVHTGGGTRGLIAARMLSAETPDRYQMVVEGSDAYEGKELEVPALQHFDAGQIELKKHEYSLEITTEGQGTVEEEIVLARSYEYGTVVRLTAVPSDGWRFGEWSGSLEGAENPQALLMDGGKSVNAAFLPLPPEIVTAEVTDIAADSARAGGNVTSEGGAPVSGRGVCYAITELPDFDDSCLESGEGPGEFAVILTGLEPDQHYYVRAWAENAAGTSFGNEVEFKTLEEEEFNYGRITDIDNNVYKTIIIGNQEWMAENLRVRRYRNGEPIPTNVSDSDWENERSGAFKVYPHENLDGLDSEEEVAEAYGLLYNWFVVNDSRGLCPEGWSVPSHQDWSDLVGYLGWNGYQNSDIPRGAGNALKSRRQVSSPLGSPWATDEHPRWSSSPRYGIDVYGFSGLPAGACNSVGIFDHAGNIALWWTSVEASWTVAYRMRLMHNSGEANLLWGSKNQGFSVRCIKDS